MPVLVIVNLALAAGLGILWHDLARVKWVEPDPVLPSLDNQLPAVNNRPVEVSQFRETLERPLFVASRRPPPPQASAGAASPDADPAKDLRLLGIYGFGNRGGAIVEYAGTIRRVPIGQKIGGWTVASAEASAASLVRGDSERRELRVALATTPPPAAAQAGAPVAASSAPAAAPAAAAKAATRARPSFSEGVQRRIEEEKARRAARAGAASPAAAGAQGKAP